MNGPKYVELLRKTETAHARPRLHDHRARWRSLSPIKVPEVKHYICARRAWNKPDLNPVENLWTIMKDKVAYKQTSSVKR